MNTCPRCERAGRVVAHGPGAAACAACGGSFKLLPDAFATFKKAGIRSADLQAILAREGKKLHPCVTCHEWMVTFPVGHELFHACVPCGGMWTDAGALDRVLAEAQAPSPGPFAGLPRTATPAPRARFAPDDLAEPTNTLMLPLASATLSLHDPAFFAPFTSTATLPPMPWPAASLPARPVPPPPDPPTLTAPSSGAIPSSPFDLLPRTHTPITGVQQFPASAFSAFAGLPVRHDEVPAPSPRITAVDIVVPRLSRPLRARARDGVHDASLALRRPGVLMAALVVAIGAAIAVLIALARH